MYPTLLPHNLIFITPVKKLLLSILLSFTISAVVNASKPSGAPDPWADYDEAVFMDMDLDGNIETPALQKNEKLAVRRYMRHLADETAAKKYQVELDRDDEVMVVIIGLDKLFMPNDTLLAPYFEKQIRPLVSLLKNPGMFKIVYAIHSDNTGSESYNYDLSQERVNSLYDWFIDHVSEDQIIIPFAMGDSDPVAPNETAVGRATNRRIEIYFIPGPEMILRARSGKLH